MIGKTKNKETIFQIDYEVFDENIFKLPRGGVPSEIYKP